MLQTKFCLEICSKSQKQQLFSVSLTELAQGRLLYTNNQESKIDRELIGKTEEYVIRFLLVYGSDPNHPFASELICLATHAIRTFDSDWCGLPDSTRESMFPRNRAVRQPTTLAELDEMLEGLPRQHSDESSSDPSQERSDSSSGLSNE